MSRPDFEKQTRAVFDTIHRGHLRNSFTLERIRSLLTEDYLRLPPGWLAGKHCLDAGCGNAANGMINLFRLGAGSVRGMDLNASFVKTAAGELEKAGYSGRYHLDRGSLMALPYDAGTFDFTLCQGVLHHVDDEMRAISELHRVLRKGGRFHFTIHGSGGLVTEFTQVFMRERLARDRKLRRGVERLSAPGVRREIAALAGLLEGGGHVGKCRRLLGLLGELIDEDLVLTVKDRLLAPKYSMFTEKEFFRMLRSAGFRNLRRVTRRPEFGNVRSILAPLYERYDSPLARLLYGEGQIQVVGSK